LHKIKIFRAETRDNLEIKVNLFFKILTSKKIIKVISSNLALFAAGSEKPFCVYIHYEEFEIDNKSLSDFGKLNAGGKEV